MKRVEWRVCRALKRNFIARVDRACRFVGCEEQVLSCGSTVARY